MSSGSLQIPGKGFLPGTIRHILRRSRSLLPRQGFVFGRPLLLIQSDDWGRVGVRDAEACELLRKSGVILGERPYDYYSLENAQDIEATIEMLRRHRDCTGRNPCLGMNFVLANVDFAKVIADGFRQIHLRPLTDGLPAEWNRPGLFQAYREGVSNGLFFPALHATTHFCRRSLARYLTDSGPRGDLLRTLWQAGVPYIHWRMPWIGFEYSAAANGKEKFLDSEIQDNLVADAVQIFSQLFSTTPRSACAPGYRANRHTYHAWASHGIRVSQNGPDRLHPPHLSANRNAPTLLHLYRTLDFEPVDDNAFSLNTCIEKAGESFARGIPVIVSIHSINFHSSLKDFRTRTLSRLDEFLSAMESRHPDLQYVHDGDLYDLIERGKFESASSAVQVKVKRQLFHAHSNARIERP